MNRRAIAVYLLVLGVFTAVVTPAAFATNGMNLEGYGPIATGMGGASMAYDNGAAAVMNNPATLALMPEGNRLDVALGYLGPRIVSTMDGMSDAGSSARNFYMPALGWIKKEGQISYGVAMFAQGGMGTEYSKDSFMAAGSGEKVRSEVSMGRLIIPFAYEVNKQFAIAASIDYVWAGMDLKMAMQGAQFKDLASTQVYGTASGSLVDTIGGFMTKGLDVNWTRFDFSDSSAYTGAAKGAGFAGKLGAVYKVNNEVTLGVTYHSKTSMGDLETDKAKVSMNVDASKFGMGSKVAMDLQGKIQVRDFEWPMTIGTGIAYQYSEKWLFVADYKYINWADVMKNFKMTFTADQSDSNNFTSSFGTGADLRGQALDATLYQNWKNQHVIMIGGAYKATAETTLRAGLNIANNPIPDTYLNALFPAIEKNHVTVGAGYQLSKASSVDASFTYAPEVKQTSDQGVTTKHYQTNAQVLYSYRF